MEVTQKNKHLSQTIMQREQDIRRSALTGRGRYTPPRFSLNPRPGRKEAGPSRGPRLTVLGTGDSCVIEERGRAFEGQTRKPRRLTGTKAQGRP